MTGDSQPSAGAAASPETRGATPAGHGPSRRRRIVGRVLAGASLVVAVMCALMWIDALAGNLIPVLQALTPVWVIMAAVLAVTSLAVRTRAVWLALVPLVISAGVAGVALAHHSRVPASTRAAAADRHLRVLSLNAELGGADVSSVMRAVREARPDVIVFVEMTAAKLTALDDAGLRTAYRHRSTGMVDSGARGSVILSKDAMTTLDADRDLGPYDLQSPTVRVAAPGADVVVRAVHTYPPLRDGVAQWRPQLMRLQQWQKAERSPHLVMAGDFNASRPHPAFRTLADGLLDAYPAVHGAWAPTWPHGGHVPPFAQIDHVLTRGFVPEAAGIVTVAGTDHAAVWTDLRY